MKHDNTMELLMYANGLSTGTLWFGGGQLLLIGAVGAVITTALIVMRVYNRRL